MTEAEKRFHKKMEERAAETARKEVEVTHRMKVSSLSGGADDRLAR